MSAVDALQVERPSSHPGPNAESATGDFAWRVLILLNLFRLAISGLLLVVFYLVDSPRIVGESNSTLAWQSLTGLLAIGCVELVLLQRRYPNATVQTYLQFCTDLIGMTLLVHASGGISSGLGGVLIVSVGTLALLVAAERAFLLAAVTALALLLEQAYAQFQGITTSAQFAPAGILGAVIFVMNILGMNMGGLRLPLVEPDENGKANLEKIMKKLGLMYSCIFRRRS